MDNLSKRRSGQKMKIICAWCGKDLGEKDGKGEEGVTHGLCQECFDKMKVEGGEGD